MTFENDEIESSESETIKDRVSFQLKYLMSPLYEELVPRLMDDFYDKYLDNYLMIGACIAEVRRIKREHKLMLRRLKDLEKSLQTDLKDYRK